MHDLLVKNGAILTMDRHGTQIEKGSVLISEGRIAWCGPEKDQPADGASRELDAGGGLILPGLINSHTHAAMTLLRGLADDLPLETWLTDHIFPAEQNLTAEAVYWGSMLAALEMIRNGVTSFCDMYLFAPQAARAADQAGLRAVIGEVIYDFPSPSYGELENGFALTRELIRNYKDHPRITGAVMPHATYTCSPPLLEKAGQICGDLDADMNIHLAETKVETQGIVEKYGKRPLEHLKGLGLVNNRLWIDHGVDLNHQEIELLAEAGVRVAHCPESNMKLASGVAPLDEMLARGVAVGLGTDGCASNNDLDLLGEMDSCAKLHKAHKLDPTAAPAEKVLSLATSLGGRVFGHDDLGRIEPGALADLIVVDTDTPHMTPMYNPVSQLIYVARGSDVRHTVCHGKVLMQDRKFTELDEAEITAKALEYAVGLRG
ncbi:amidohydrolase [Dethiosulfatarculus sandiegensis]|uniref:5-methylthioadenosine/S-adenosylhomocysteine deaminase n=1 Tax=Dethiosulfatarculus sandiegensis TaxID=1429043 RepID=A0A0D2JBP7_9BACT|nr:amidohydrolase [Dethiosulfatarculus sandiegensis]KIX15554.1 amidohydrolase [Dethiosulfatarculus sandiegensis]